MATATPPDDAAREIVTRVAAIRDVAPTALPPLQETVDADALGALIDGPFSGTCSFTYADCAVRVSGDGGIRVTPRLGDVRADAGGQQRQRRHN